MQSVSSTLPDSTKSLNQTVSSPAIHSTQSRETFENVLYPSLETLAETLVDDVKVKADTVKPAVVKVDLVVHPPPMPHQHIDIDLNKSYSCRNCGIDAHICVKDNKIMCNNCKKTDIDAYTTYNLVHNRPFPCCVICGHHNLTNLNKGRWVCMFCKTEINQYFLKSSKTFVERIIDNLFLPSDALHCRICGANNSVSIDTSKQTLTCNKCSSVENYSKNYSKSHELISIFDVNKYCKCNHCGYSTLEFNIHKLWYCTYCRSTHNEATGLAKALKYSIYAGIVVGTIGKLARLISRKP
jgi:hypothetical protein